MAVLFGVYPAFDQRFRKMFEPVTRFDEPEPQVVILGVFVVLVEFLVIKCRFRDEQCATVDRSPQQHVDYGVLELVRAIHPAEAFSVFVNRFDVA